MVENAFYAPADCEAEGKYAIEASFDDTGSRNERLYVIEASSTARRSPFPQGEGLGIEAKVTS